MKYIITTVGDFYEIFDTENKITVFVTESKNEAILYRKKFEEGLDVSSIKMKP